MAATPTCQTCGASVKRYNYRITKGLVDILLIMIDHVRATGKNEFTMKEVRENLKPFQYTQLTKLRFHALIVKVLDDEGKWTGKWLISRRAGQFLSGKLSIPLHVETYRNKVVGHDTKLVNIKEVYGSVIYLEGGDIFHG